MDIRERSTDDVPDHVDPRTGQLLLLKMPYFLVWFTPFVYTFGFLPQFLFQRPFEFVLFIVIWLSVTIIPMVIVVRGFNKHFMFRVRPDAIEITSGVLTEKTVKFPYSKVQMVTVSRGWFEQSMGLSTVIVGTRLGALVGSIPGLTPEEAEVLSDVLLGRMSVSSVEEKDVRREGSDEVDRELLAELQAIRNLLDRGESRGS